MNDAPNQEVVNDTAKLIMHRLIVRTLARNPSLLERAKAAHAKASERFSDRSFVQGWHNLLERPLPELRARLISRSQEMYRMRLSSPFIVADGVDFTDPAVRRRIWSAARRLADRSTREQRPSTRSRPTAA